MHTGYLAAGFIASVLCLCPVASAQQAPPPAETPAQGAGTSEVSLEGIEKQGRLLQESKDLDEALKTKLTEIYNRALEALRSAQRDNAKFQQLEQAAQEAPSQLTQLKAELAQPLADVKAEEPDDATLAQLQQTLNEAEKDLAGWQKTLGELEQEPRKRAERRLAVPKELAASRQQLEEIRKQLAAEPAPEESPEALAARKTLLSAQEKAVEANLRALEQEPVSYEVLAELLTLRRDQTARNVSQAEKLVKAWQKAVNERRQAEVEQQAREAQLTAARAHPAVSQRAEKNAGLVEHRKIVVSKIVQVTHENKEIDKKRVALDDEYQKVNEKEERVGLTEAIGLLLRKKRADLPKVGEHRRRIDLRQSEIAQVSLQLIEYEDARSKLADVDSRVAAILRSLEGSIRPSDDDSVESDLRNLLEAKRGYLESLITDSGTYLEKLVELDINERDLVSKTREYIAYIDERILWVRSTSPLRLWSKGTPPDYTPSDLQIAFEAAKWLTTPGNWTHSGTTLWSDSRENPSLYLVALLLFSALTVTQRRRRTALRLAGQRASRSYITSFLPTLQALGITLSLALPGALILGFLGWRLGASATAVGFDQSLGRALGMTAAVLLSLEFFRQICRPEGLGESHFRWPHESVRIARRTLWQLIVLGLPLGFFVAAFEALGNDAWHNSLGRLFFIGWMLVLAACLRRVLRPTGSVLQKVLAHNRGGWVDLLRYVWYPASVAMPIFLAVLAALGYYYTAAQLARRLLLTLWLVQGLVLATALFLRWLMLTYRALAIKQARQRRATAQSESKAASATEPTQAQPVETEFDLSTINVQTRKLLRTAVLVVFFAGMWLVWSEVLPALGFLRHVHLWSTTVAGSEGVPILGYISLADLLLALGVAAFTVAASRNLPGLLEMVVLQRLPMEPGTRFAVTTVSRYAITIVGFVIAFTVIGVGWSKVQWLVAAMTVGLGFGLQEIFANFISGLILLLERPIRVGDIVTVGDVTGKVSRIRIRATTVTDWDMRELIVPNKEFITGRIINWTLSDTLSRMTITVGVAYGSDPELTRNLLLQVADQHPHVLKEPAPHALFDGFGDSTLNFTLRVYMASRSVYLKLRHEMHVGIDTAFREAGIEIAFPQQDLHIRSVDQAVDLSSSTAAQKIHSRT